MPQQPQLATPAYSILLVEDEVLVRLAVADELRQEGYSVIEAASTDEALEVLGSDVAIDLVLTDLRTAGSLDGVNFVRRVNSDLPHIKLLLAVEDAARSGSAIEADGFFAKPYRFPELLSQIRSLLEPKPA